MPSDIVLIPFAPDHIADAIRLSKAAGWPHRAEDWALVLGLSRGVVACVDGQVVATALATPFGPRATVNMIIVAEEMRGRGIGRRMMEAAMSELVPEAWHLVATGEGLPLYRKLGFEACGSVHQFQGIVRDGAWARSDAQDLRWATEVECAALAGLDRLATGMDRMSLIKALLRDGRIICATEDDTPVAWAAIRRFGHGEVAGPVIARNAREARRLLGSLFAARAGRFLRIDTPDGTGLDSWLIESGLDPVGGGTSMVRGTPAQPRSSCRRFALAAQALW